MTNENPSQKRLALVTGAAGSMGTAVARQLVELGHQVILCDVREEPLRELAASLGVGVHPVSLDISDERQVVSAIADLQSTLGPIEILINNAGILSNHHAETTASEEWLKVMNVNLNGAFYLARSVLPGMKAQRWGRIVNTCSLAAKTGGLTAGTAYTTSKGALMSLTFSLARETAPYGITVNGIAPAYVRTPMVTEHLSESERQQLLTTIPVGRFCEPEEFAHTVSFLIHPLSGFITGEVIDQNGGLHFD